MVLCQKILPNSQHQVFKEFVETSIVVIVVVVVDFLGNFFVGWQRQQSLLCGGGDCSWKVEDPV